MRLLGSLQIINYSISNDSRGDPLRIATEVLTLSRVSMLEMVAGRQLQIGVSCIAGRSLCTSRALRE